MRRRAILVLTSAAALPVLGADRLRSGRWVGQADFNGMAMPLVIDIDRGPDGRWIGSVTLPGRRVKGAPLAGLSVDARGARFTLAAAFLAPPEPAPAVTLQWRGADRATGTLVVDGLAASLALQRDGAAQVDRTPGSTPIDAALLGTWVGRYELGGAPRDVTLTLRRNAAGLGDGTLVIVGRRRTELALDRVRQSGGYVALHAGAAGFAIEGRLDGTRLAARLEQGPFEAALPLRRVEAER